MKPDRSQANICLTLILWRALPFSCMSLRDLQTGSRSGKHWEDDTKNGWKQVQTHYCHFPHPYFMYFCGQEMVFDFAAPFIFSMHYKWIWGMPTMFEFKANARNPGQQLHTKIFWTTTLPCQCVPPHTHSLLCLEYAVSKLSSSNLGFALKHKCSSKTLRLGILTKIIFLLYILSQ